MYTKILVIERSIKPKNSTGIKQIISNFSKAEKNNIKSYLINY